MTPSQIWRWSALAVLTCCLSVAAVACQVPVFRFAIERWRADRYEIVVLHQGPLSEQHLGRLTKLRDSDHRSSVSANFEVRAVDVSASDDPELQRLWRENDQQGVPLVVSLYPPNAREVPDRIADVSPLSDEHVARLIDSPARRRIAERLTDGDSAVWIFVPGGNEEQDAAALKRLEQQVQLNQQQLRLPPIDAIESDEFFSADTKIELRLSFSIVTLERDDPGESFLLSLLMESEPDLWELADQPMAFPVLGRGRVLYALVGKGIGDETIASASRFIVGPCSCQVKEQNPGFDLLMAVDWDEKVGSEVLSRPLLANPAPPTRLAIPPGNTNKAAP